MCIRDRSRGNVVNPDDIVDVYGADTLRTYEMFIGAFALADSWSEDGVKGCRRFLDRVWKLQDLSLIHIFLWFSMLMIGPANSSGTSI